MGFAQSYEKGYTKIYTIFCILYIINGWLFLKIRGDVVTGVNKAVWWDLINNHKWEIEKVSKAFTIGSGERFSQ